jgi:uncharacterized protein YegP (UPF0339 family)
MYFYLFQDANSQWRWNYRSANHKIIADSAESYVSKSDALHGISLIKSNAASSNIYDGTQKKWLN